MPVVFALLTLLRQHDQTQMWKIPHLQMPVVFALFTLLQRHDHTQIWKILHLQMPVVFALFMLLGQPNQMQIWKILHLSIPVVFALFTLSQQHCRVYHINIKKIYDICTFCIFLVYTVAITLLDEELEMPNPYFRRRFFVYVVAAILSDADMENPSPIFQSSLLCLRSCGNTVRYRYGKSPT
jgi:hypothetical protein